ncbi:FAD-dependent oxidoreductase [Methanobacterium paludis]|uniref:succinate dehydrogenase n=1 Tax=Methanobacterium paludis (strain DSM 25820 / JCM 18151 / SWAN1) TaxID=868131 RepID=F6D6F4_METPW|nr:FAD-dependent oxidoreductase [Methanobacterium paludis]AEG19387.1 succinate dehydrogenase or fumarate reductase, flavoprotein subunit [Methanobacterium paludis]
MEVIRSIKDKKPPSRLENFKTRYKSLKKYFETNGSRITPDKEVGTDLDLSSIHRYDVVIIGGGLTGLRAAIRVSDAGLNVAVISKVHPLRSHSVAAHGGMNASLGNVPGPDDTADSWKMHAYDTIKGSDYLADQDAVVLMCREAPKTVIELEHMGTAWSRLENGKIAQRPFGGVGFPRTCYAADRSGHNALNTLYEQIVSRNIRVYEEFFVTSLVTEHGQCTGCTALDIMTGLIHGFAVKAVLMSTGGFGRIFDNSTNALINTGDGQALALRAGAPLKDMEFVQFHPTTLYGTNILITEGARGEGGILLNQNGERFMERYAPQSMDLAPRDVVARAIEQEIAEGKGFNGGYVHLDLRHVGADQIKKRLPGIRQISMDFAGVDPIKDPLPVQTGQHYSMGGIHVDINGATPISGLYAAGECACISVHGANRLGGNSLLETVVFGRLVADSIIRDIPNMDEPSLEPIKHAMQEKNSWIDEILKLNEGENLFKIMDEMKKTMSDKFGIYREDSRMQEGLLKIKKLQEQSSHVSINNKERVVNQTLIRFFELENMLYLAEAVAMGALGREESRGSHSRTDYPKRDDEGFLKHTMISMKDNQMQLSYKPVNIGMFEPEERFY